LISNAQLTERSLKTRSGNSSGPQEILKGTWSELWMEERSILGEGSMLYRRLQIVLARQFFFHPPKEDEMKFFLSIVKYMDLRRCLMI